MMSEIVLKGLDFVASYIFAIHFKNRILIFFFIAEVVNRAVILDSR